MKIFTILAGLIASVCHAEAIRHDFTKGELHGWTVETGEVLFRGGLAAAIPAGEDGAHPTFLARSPMFRLDEEGELAVTLTGGHGGSIPISSRALPPNSTGGGPMGVALRRVTDDAWVLVARMPQNGGKSTLKFSQSQLATLLTKAHDEVYTLDFFDAGHGGWGHAELVDVSIPGKAVDPLPEAPKGFETARPLFLGAVHGRLAYDKNELFATPGSRLALTLFNSDEMAHNWVLCKPSPKVADELGLYVMDNIAAMTATDFIPKDPRILRHSTLVAPGTSDTQYFEAPSELGDYPFVCTFPGHHISMRGVLHVREELPLPKPDQIKPATPADEFQLVVRNAPVIQRGPLKDGGPAVICVGTPEGVNFAFDTALCTISHVWITGPDEPFLSTKAAWDGRGGQALEARGQMKFQTKEPSSLGETKFHAYKIAANGLPSFEFAAGGATVRVRLEPGENALLAHFESDSKQPLTWKLEPRQSFDRVEVPGQFTVRYELSN